MSCRFFKSISVESKDSDIIVNYGNIPNLTLLNLRNYRFVICQCIPKPKKPNNIGCVTFKINGVKYHVLTNSGNDFRTDQLRRDVMYYTVYGNNPEHILVKNWVPPTADANVDSYNKELQIDEDKLSKPEKLERPDSPTTLRDKK